IDDYAVALLGDIPVEDAWKVINDLDSLGLIESSGSRFGMHDLLHDYAQGLVEDQETDGERQITLERLLYAYYGCVSHAFNIDNPNNPMLDSELLAAWTEADPAGSEAVTSFESASRWFATERANLLELASVTCQMNPSPMLAPKLAFSLFYFLEAAGYWED